MGQKFCEFIEKFGLYFFLNFFCNKILYDLLLPRTNFMFAKNQISCKKGPYSELLWSAFFPHFPAFGLNTEKYEVSLRIQFKCGKMREKCGPE